jgi:hypothetical protein
VEVLRVPSLEAKRRDVTYQTSAASDACNTRLEPVARKKVW